jgi:hypothetical protein
VDDGAESGLALDDGVGDTHLAAERGQEDDELNGVDIVGDEDERSLLVLNQANNVVETVLDNVGLLADVLLLLALLDGGGLLEKTLLLLSLGLRAVLVEELEGLGSGVLVEDLLELGDGRRDLQAHVEDLLLALEADILRPLNHARQVTGGLDGLADAEVAGPLLEERVLDACQRTRLGGGGYLAGGATHLGGLLGTGLPLREGGRGDLLSRLGRLSLRRRHQQMFYIDCGLLCSKERPGGVSAHHEPAQAILHLRFCNQQAEFMQLADPERSLSASCNYAS